MISCAWHWPCDSTRRPCKWCVRWLTIPVWHGNAQHSRMFMGNTPATSMKWKDWLPRRTNGKIRSGLDDTDCFWFRSKFLLPFDHHFPGKITDEQQALVTVVLYGDFGNQPEFRPFHSKLSSLALNGKIDYVLRHNTPVSTSETIIC